MSDAAGFAEAELSCDALLDGRVRLWQPRRGYRAATDPVLLAAACPARPGDRVLDLGCGAGAAILCLAARVPRLALHGLELQPAYASLARRNAAAAGLAFTVHEGDVAAPPAALRGLVFDHVIANPPYFLAADAPSPQPGRDLARRSGEGGPAVWIDAALRRLRQGGWLTVIHRTERLAEILEACSGRAASIAIRPLSPRAGRDAGRFVMRARKDSGGPLRLCAPLVLHAGLAHEGDGDDFSAEARAILRDAGPMTFGDSAAATPAQ